MQPDKTETLSINMGKHTKAQSFSKRPLNPLREFQIEHPHVKSSNLPRLGCSVPEEAPTAWT